MSGRVQIRVARADDAGHITWMLKQLAIELGDGTVFASTESTIRRHGFGPDASFSTMLAETDGAPQGLALYFRHFSTTRGLPGVYVQDLWIAPEQRGARLGTRLLATVAENAAHAWEAAYLTLSVYHDNPAAAQFYSRLGFAAHQNDAPMSLTGPAFKDLAGSAGSLA
jgi:GNAT superfamily N-acetyltransferase